MLAVIYDTENTHIIKRYKTLAAAKSALTRAQKSGSMRYLTSFGYGLMKADRIAKLEACTTQHFYDEVDHEVEVRNIMSGKMFKIARSEQGGPCDPSTERYWSM